MADHVEGQRPRDRGGWRLRLSLRGMLVLVALAGLWLADRCNRARDQRRAVEVILRVRGAVRYDWEPAPPKGWGVGGASPGLEPPAPRRLRRLLGDDFFQEVVDVELFRKDLAEADFVALGRLTSLESLLLTGSTFRDEWLVHLEGLRRLKHLQLGLRSTGDLAMRHVGRLSALEDLTLTWTAVSDAGLADLTRLPGLRNLGLAHAPVTDRGVRDLLDRADLREICLNGTRVSREGVKDLRRRHPGTTVESSFDRDL